MYDLRYRLQQHETCSEQIYMKQNATFLRNKLVLLSLGLSVIIIANIILLYFITGNMDTISLLKEQEEQLLEDQQIISQSQELIGVYEGQIGVISEVFPNEASILEFIQSLESLIQNASSEYSFKFNSLTPLAEGDLRFLVMTVTMNSDFNAVTLFLETLELLPYMTHVTSISSKTPQGYLGTAEYTVVFKVYVKNPFTT